MITAEAGYEFATSEEADEGKTALSVSSIIDKTSSDDRIVFVRKLATEGYNASVWQAVIIKGRPAAPKGQRSLLFWDSSCVPPSLKLNCIF
jgi:hypothetical protein